MPSGIFGASAERYIVWPFKPEAPMPDNTGNKKSHDAKRRPSRRQKERQKKQLKQTSETL